MAELAASAVGLAAFGLQLTGILNKYASSAKDADGRIDAILYDVRLTTAVLGQFGEYLDENTQVSMSEEAKTITKNAVERCKTVFDEIHMLITGKKLSNQSNVAGTRVEVNIRKRLAWPFVEPKLELWRSNLEKIKTTLQLLMSLLTWGVIRRT
jgi:hypothetical protein